MDEIWTRLENFLQKNAPKIYEGLAPGATEAEIAAVEKICGQQFPSDVRQSYLRHNGHALDDQSFIPDYFDLLPLSCVSDTWESNISTIEYLKDEITRGDGASAGVKPVSLDPAWIPFAGDCGGNQICLDFDPAPGGNVGQIVEYDHEAHGQQCLAPNFRTWLNTIVSDLETGRLVWNEELRGYDYPEEDATD